MASPSGSVIVTGANGGLGTAIVNQIVRNPDLSSKYKYLYTVRKAATATQLKAALANTTATHQHEIVDLDLSSLDSVRKTAAEINRRVSAGELAPIRALILNAGYQDHKEINFTNDGFETSWQVNFLSNMLLTLLLLQSMDKQDGRILLVGSWSHDINDERNNSGGGDPFKGYSTLYPGAKELAKGEWSGPETEGGWFTGFRRYGASKLCAIMLLHELADRIGKDPELSNISVLGLDPGGMSSDLVRRGDFMVRVVTVKILIPLLAFIMGWFNPNGPLRTLSKSAGDIVRACFEIEAPKGVLLYLNGTDEYETSKEAQNAENRRTLWDYSLQAADIKEGDTVLKNWR